MGNFSTRFLLSENHTVNTPSELYFPTEYREGNSLAADVLLLDDELYNSIPEEQKGWLTKVGVQELSNKSFIAYLYNNSEYINTSNAIDIGRFLFETSRKENFFADSEYSSKLWKIQFLTKKGTLKNANSLYLGSAFKPEFDIEQVCGEDIFVSEEYCKDDSLSEWKLFFLKMNMSEDIASSYISVSFTESGYGKRFDSRFFKEIKQASERYGWVSCEGWSSEGYDFGFSAGSIALYTYSFFEHLNNYSFSKLILSRLCAKYLPSDIKSYVPHVSGCTGMIGRTVDADMIRKFGCKTNHFDWLLDNYSIIPTTTGYNMKACYVFSNAIPDISTLAGQYLPVIDIDDTITEEWQTKLSLKTFLSFADYLQLLEKISYDEDKANDNKQRVSNIYQKLIELDVLKSEEKKTQIKDWAKTHRLISQEGKLQLPSELSYVTLEGFKANTQVYIGNPSKKDDVIELMMLMGVNVITEDSIKPEFGEYKETNEIKDCLVSKIPALALLAAGDNPTEEIYDKAKASLIYKIEETCFYNCSKICLSYGNADDVIEKTTFGMGKDFYYIGNLRPANLEPLMAPLCKHLEIKGRDSELFVLMIEDNEGVKAYLKEKGYNIDLIKEDIVVGSEKVFNPTLNYTPSISQDYCNQITGYKGEIIIYEYLKKQGYEPICPSISDETDYEREVVMGKQTYYCKPNYERYDITFKTKSGLTTYIEVKSTVRSIGSLQDMPISAREWSMIDECDNSAEDTYVIARVFDVDSNEPDVYFLKGHKIEL